MYMYVYRSEVNTRCPLIYSPPYYLRQSFSLNLTPNLCMGSGDLNVGLHHLVASWVFETRQLTYILMLPVISLLVSQFVRYS